MDTHVKTGLLSWTMYVHCVGLFLPHLSPPLILCVCLCFPFSCVFFLPLILLSLSFEVLTKQDDGMSIIYIWVQIFAPKNMNFQRELHYIWAIFRLYAQLKQWRCKLFHINFRDTCVICKSKPNLQSFGNCPIVTNINLTFFKLFKDENLNILLLQNGGHNWGSSAKISQKTLDNIGSTFLDVKFCSQR